MRCPGNKPSTIKARSKSKSCQEAEGGGGRWGLPGVTDLPISVAAGRAAHVQSIKKGLAVIFSVLAVIL